MVHVYPFTPQIYIFMMVKIVTSTHIVQNRTNTVISFFTRHASEKTQLLQEINNLKELLNTYEKSIERKDQVISNLTGALQKQKDKHGMMKKFCDWKIKHNDVNREVGFIPSI